MKKHDLMPFGKLKGTPLADIARDKEYTKRIMKKLIWSGYPKERQKLIKLIRELARENDKTEAFSTK
jgi:uncharacterized protein (DUF3820 family)